MNIVVIVIGVFYQCSVLRLFTSVIRFLLNRKPEQQLANRNNNDKQKKGKTTDVFPVCIVAFNKKKSFIPENVKKN